LVLEYLYTGHIEVNVENAVAIAACAHQLEIPKLKEAVIQYIRETVGMENVVKFVGSSVNFAEAEALGILTIVTDYWAKNFNELSQGIDLSILPCHIITSLLESDELEAEEEKVFYLVKKYMDKNISKLVQEDILKLWHCVRFCFLPVKVLEDASKDNSIPKEWIIEGSLTALKMAYNEKTVKTALTISQERSSSTLHVVYRGSKSGSGSWGYGSGNDAICFTTDKPIKLVGIGAFGSQSGESSAEVTVLKNGAPVYKATHKYPPSTSFEPMQVKLEKAVFIESNTIYELILKISGNSSYRISDGSQTVSQAGVTFSFVNSNNSNNGTSVGLGQIPTLYFKK